MEIYPEIEDYEVLSSGTIITVPGKKITFKIRDIIFELSFENNNDLSDHKISFEIPEGTKIMKILFENFNNSLGMGNTVHCHLAILITNLCFLIIEYML